MTDRPVPATPTWNLLATSLEGHREALLYALRPLARFRRGGFPNVMVATVEDPTAFLDALREAYERSQLVRGALGKVIPITKTFRLASPETFIDEVAAALELMSERLSSRTFFVRVFRRGHRNAIDSTRAEGEVGARLITSLESRGAHAKVSFADPDFVVVIETLRDEIGIALLDRELRATYPFTKVR